MTQEIEVPKPFLVMWCIYMLERAGYSPDDLNIFMHVACFMLTVGREYPEETLKVLEQNSFTFLKGTQKFDFYYKELTDLADKFIEEFNEHPDSTKEESPA